MYIHSKYNINEKVKGTAFISHVHPLITESI